MTTTAAKTENRAGYKKTELGWIPTEWDVSTLGGLGQIVTGSTPSTSVQEYYQSGSKLWASPADLGKTKYIYDTKSKLSNEGFDKTRKIPAKSVLVTCIGSTIGKIGLAYKEMSTNQQINSIICNDMFDAEFCYYSICRISEKIRQLASEQAVPICNKTQLSSFTIPVPPLPEQRKIAEILTCWDRAIETTETLIQTKTRLKNALMQQLLTGKKRFGEFVSHPRNVTPLKSYLVESTIKNTDNKCQRVLSVTNSRGFINQNEQFERSVASKNLKTYKIVKKGQFAYNPSRINVGSIDLLTSFDEGIVSPIYVVFKTDSSKLIDTYFKHFFKAHQFFEQMKNYLQGSVRDNLSFDGLCQMKMFIPSIDEQRKIAAVLNTCDRELNLLNKQLDAYKEQKKGLMQKLLTGHIRVKVS